MELLSHSPEDTEDIGARLAEQLEPGAVVEYAILGEGCRIGRDCHVGGTPESVAEGAPWGLTVLGPGCQVESGRQIAPGTMLNSSGEEVSK